MAIPIAARSSSGITLYEGLPTPGNKPTCPPIQSKACRTMLFDQDGKYLAYVNGQTLCVLQTDNWQTLATIENVKAYQLAFSPKGTFIMSWEPFTVTNANPQGSPNLKIYKTANGELVKTFVHKKQANWEPQWSHDEKLFSRVVNTDVVFYEDLNFERIVARINSSKVSSYKISPNVGVYFVLCHTLGSPGQPSLARLFKYPAFDTTQAIANRSFFQADKVDIMWNAKGNSALLLTSTEVDKTGGSYYGKQGLYFVGLNGETSIITLSKEGPIYSVEWSPKNNEFCVVYGFMPAKATIFNIKCEPVFELGSGPKNAIHYNPQGNILLLGGFGNLRGQIELWDTANWKKISSCEAPDTTLLHWAADGEHFLTATTALGKDSAPSKASLKQKKKREAKKAKKLEEVNEDEPKTPAVVSSVKINLTGDPELDKKLKNIKKKLDAIEKLKTQQAEGKTLEINQLEKIKAENDLLAELKNLTV
ncbi:unnamed protein product [Diabrotica balteata]|uniref:Eukaryotic translation initiation factor 2A n=1 Tax=Diabrotica balteata TaxID=107213 RepID=A0A9N9T7W1_DIABA|nr:unnamed protein product [Diabrotica balteata]